MKLPAKIVIATIVTIALAVLGTFVLQLNPAHDNLLFRSELAITSALAIMYAGTAILFMAGVKAYKAKMRRAFTTLAAGILLTAIGTLQLPIANAFDLFDTVWATSGLIILPFLLGGLVAYLGIVLFGRLVGTRALLTRAALVIAAVLVLSALSTLLPHDISRASEIEFDVSNAILVWTGLLNFASTLIVLQVRQHIGTHYTNAMTWLLFALIGSILVVAAALLHALLTPADANADAVFNNISNVIGIFVGAIYLRAGYVFSQTEEY